LSYCADRRSETCTSDDRRQSDAVGLASDMFVIKHKGFEAIVDLS
jgi:hypothetical protein